MIMRQQIVLGILQSAIIAQTPSLSITGEDVVIRNDATQAGNQLTMLIRVGRCIRLRQCNEKRETFE